jgi:hypothetical protein
MSLRLGHEVRGYFGKPSTLRTRADHVLGASRILRTMCRLTIRWLEATS